MYSGIVEFRGTNRFGQHEYTINLLHIRIESIVDLNSVRCITTFSGTSHYVFDTVDDIAKKIGWA